MTQLWLNGRRMDSIPLLRRFMSACQDEETLLRILGELMRKYQAGRLAGWLIRQSEAQPQPALALRLNEEKTQIPLLLSEPQIPVEEILPALAELCAPEKALREKYLTLLNRILDEALLDTLPGKAEKQQLIQNQAWYPSLSKLFEHIDWDYVAADTEGLLAILQRVQQEPHSGQTAVYLCDTGKNYRIDQPLQLRRLRLIGCGRPKVYIASHNRNRKLDLVAQDLHVEGLILYRNGLILEGTERLKDIEER